MKTPRLAPFLLLSGLLTSCSSSIQVENGHYGVKTRMGEVVEIITGPGTAQKSFLDHVVVFPRKKDIEIASPGQEPIRLSVDVVDPARFYALAAGQFEILVSYYERNTKQLSKEEATTVLLGKLNEPKTGIVAKMPNPSIQSGRAEARR